MEKHDNTKGIIIKGKVFEIKAGEFVDYIAFQNLNDLTKSGLGKLYLTPYQSLYGCYKNPCKKKVLRYSNNLLYMKRLEFDNSVYSRHIGILEYNDKVFTQRFIMVIENFNYIVDFDFYKNTIIICSQNYEKAIDALKSI